MVGRPVMTWPLAVLITVEAAGVLVVGVLFPRLMIEKYGTPAQPAPRHLHVLQTDDVSGVRAIQDAGPYDWAADVDGAA